MAGKERSLLLDLARSGSLETAAAAVKDLEVKFGYSWRPVGDNEANYGLVNIGSDPGLALVERVTNAIDAVIEREALRRLGKKGEHEPASPREATELWFGVPGGRVGNLGDAAKRQPLADEVVVSLFDGTEKFQPTVEIRDLGVGLTPSLIPRTILSLSGSNKLNKMYLAGAYGQGGSTALAFSPNGTLFVSRRQPDLLARDDVDQVAVTVARYEDLDPRRNKNGRYSFLVNTERQVAAIPANAFREFEPGTRVVHFDLGIENYAARLTQLRGSLWSLFQNALFDPILPFWAVEARSAYVEKKGGKPDRRTIAGNFTRLTDDAKDRVEYANSVKVTLDHPAGETSVNVNYWVIRHDDAKSSQPTDAYVDPYRPIAYTYFGQTHGTDERRFTAERLQLPYLAKFLILQVELDDLTPKARRDILSSTRDRLKAVPLFGQIREEIVGALSEDDELHRLNDLRKEQILSQHSERDRERMRERFARLMERLTAGTTSAPAGKGGERGGRESGAPGSRGPLPPLPTADEPTFVRIANARSPMPVRLDRHALLRLESDAPDGYLSKHIHAKLTVGTSPDGLLVLESRSDFRGGRSRVVVRAGSRATAGDEGIATIFLFTPSDQTHSASIKFVIEAPKEAPTAGDARRSDVRVPEPVPIYRAGWEEFGWNETSVAQVSDDADGAKIYVNMDNRHITRLLQAGGYQESGVARMKNNFLLYVAFYAWAQFSSTRSSDVGIEGKALEDYVAGELDRAAQTVVHSISASARLADEE